MFLTLEVLNVMDKSDDYKNQLLIGTVGRTDGG